MAEYLDRIERSGLPKGLVREAMEAAAIGLSTAVIRPPAVYATTAEISELARAAGERAVRAGLP